jgi:hypothetical protein
MRKNGQFQKFKAFLEGEAWEGNTTKLPRVFQAVAGLVQALPPRCLPLLSASLPSRLPTRLPMRTMDRLRLGRPLVA